MIISGVYATGYGDVRVRQPEGPAAGSFYTEPANIPHYIEIKDRVLQVSGTGPSKRQPVGQAK